MAPGNDVLERRKRAEERSEKGGGEERMECKGRKLKSYYGVM